MSASRPRLVAGLRLLAAVAWLTLALAVFRFPLGRVFGPWAHATGLAGLFTSPAPGFMLEITSDPPGGRLLVDGEDQGEVPLIANVRCREGEAVRLEVVREGFAPWRREVGCREGRTLRVRARLVR